MQYKIGQRVEWCNSEIWVLEIDTKGRLRIGEKGNEISVWVSDKEISPLYKPGDKVRVKSRGELKKHCDSISLIACDQWYDFAGKLVTLSRETEDEDGAYWEIDQHPELGFAPDNFEWYSGAEDKPEIVRIEKGKEAEQLMDILGPTIFVAEVHQDKERNKAVLAEVIGTPTSTRKWQCPYCDKYTYECCKFTGTKQDVRQHHKVAHGETLPPIESHNYWLKRQVS